MQFQPLQLHARLLLQEATIRLRQNLIIIWLKRKPAFRRQSNLCKAVGSFFVVDERLLVAAPLRRCVDEQLCMTGLVQAQEPESSGIDGLADLEGISIWMRQLKGRDLR